MIFNTTGGGGGLNFKIVGGTTRPIGSIKENTIWVNTDTDISEWEISATQPANATEGMVWLSTGTTSEAAFNALKKNTLIVYPAKAQQYVSGAWKNKDAYWDYYKAEQVMRKFDVQCDPVVFWACLNAEYSDRCEVNKKFGLDTIEYYVECVKAFWLEDEDAVKDKPCAYYKHIVKH